MTCYWPKRKLISYLHCTMLEILRNSCICLLSMDLSHSIFCAYTQDQKKVFVLPKANNNIHYEPTSAPLVSWNRHTLNTNDIYGTSFINWNSLFMVAEHLLNPHDNYNYFTLNTQRKSTHYLFYKTSKLI